MEPETPCATFTLSVSLWKYLQASENEVTQTDLKTSNAQKIINKSSVSDLK